MTRGFGGETVIEGLDGYLFHRDHQAVEQVTGDLSLPPSLLEAWVQATLERISWCLARNIIFRFLIVPEKHVVLAHKLPKLNISADRPASALITALPEAAMAATLYPVRLLQEEEGSYLLNDSHWSDAAAFAVLRALLDTLPEDYVYPPVDAGKLRPRLEQKIGDLGRRLDPQRSEKVTRLVQNPPQPFRQIYYNGLMTRGSTIVYEGHPAGRRMVMFRDSFATSLIPYMVPSFARSVYVSSCHVHRDLVEAEMPDLVVLQIAERFLGNLDGLGQQIDPTDQNLPPFETQAGISPIALAANAIQVTLADPISRLMG